MFIDMKGFPFIIGMPVGFPPFVLICKPILGAMLAIPIGGGCICMLAIDAIAAADRKSGRHKY